MTQKQSRHKSYNACKTMLKLHAKEVKTKFSDDKPLCRQSINDFADMLCKSHLSITEKQKEWLHSLAGKLHPK